MLEMLLARRHAYPARRKISALHRIKRHAPPLRGHSNFIPSTRGFHCRGNRCIIHPWPLYLALVADYTRRRGFFEFSRNADGDSRLSRKRSAITSRPRRVCVRYKGRKGTRLYFRVFVSRKYLGERTAVKKDRRFAASV